MDAVADSVQRRIWFCDGFDVAVVKGIDIKVLCFYNLRAMQTDSEAEKRKEKKCWKLTIRILMEDCCN